MVQGSSTHRLHLQARLRGGQLLGCEAAAAQHPRLLLLIPVVLIGSQALTSVQTLQGLEGKMNGAVGAGGAAGEKSG